MYFALCAVVSQHDTAAPEAADLGRKRHWRRFKRQKSDLEPEHSDAGPDKVPTSGQPTMSNRADKGTRGAGKRHDLNYFVKGMEIAMRNLKGKDAISAKTYSALVQRGKEGRR